MTGRSICINLFIKLIYYMFYNICNKKSINLIISGHELFILIIIYLVVKYINKRPPKSSGRGFQKKVTENI